MNKLMMRLPAILIGLSIFIFLFHGCILTEIDPPEKKYFDLYRNKSNSILTISLKNIDNEQVETIILDIDKENGLVAQDVAFNGGDKPVAEYIPLSSIIKRAKFAWFSVF